MSPQQRQNREIPTNVLQRNFPVSYKFTSLCKLHQEQSSITSHCKKTKTNPIQASGFLSHVQIDLIDFCKITCNCSKKHNWVLHVEGHFSKYPWLFPLSHKETSEVTRTLELLFWVVGFPSKLQSVNGGEFASKVMTAVQKGIHQLRV